MTRFIYPRLPLAVATARIAEIQEAFSAAGRAGVAALADVSHPRAAPVATGGRVGGVDHIAEVREAVVSHLETWMAQQAVTRAQAAAFDLALGRVLHDRLDIVPADAAHDETWSFLTLIVLPDVAVVRFPDLHPSRLIGTPRNVLRRPWIRQEVLGNLLHTGNRPLGEDELVGMFERTALARNRRLLRSLAAAVLDYSGPAPRSDWARELYKRVTFGTGPCLLDALSDNEIDALIRSAESDVSPRQG